MRFPLFILPLGAAVILGGCGGCSKPAPAPEIPPPSPFERAIAALGGRARLAAITSIETRTRGEEHGRPYTAQVRVHLPDQYRTDIETSDALLAQAQAGGKLWGTFEEILSPLKPEDAVTLRQNWRLLHLSLLVPLETMRGVTIRADGRDGDLDIVEVTFPDDPKGPFRLGFDVTSAYLRRVEWKAEIFGASKPRSARLDFFDHRPFDGITVATRARFSIDGELMLEERVEEMNFNRPFPPTTFEEPAPSKDLLIRERTAGEVTVGILEYEGSSASAAEEAETKLQHWIDRYRLQRNGPSFRLQPMVEGGVPAVGVPIVPPPAETRPTTRGSDEPKVSTIPAHRVLSAALKGGDAAAHQAAIRQLTDRAKKLGADITGPCRVVRWPSDITQLQVPIHRKE